MREGGKESERGREGGREGERKIERGWREKDRERVKIDR